MFSIETQSRKLSTEVKTQIHSHLWSSLPFGKQVFMEKVYNIDIRVIEKQLKTDMFNMIKEIADEKVGLFERYKKEVIQFKKKKQNGEAVNRIPLKTFPLTPRIREKFQKVIHICEDLYDLIKPNNPNLTLKKHLDQFFQKFLILEVWEGWIKKETLWKWAKPLVRGQLKTPQNSPQKSDKTSCAPKPINKSLFVESNASKENILNPVQQSAQQTSAPTTQISNTPPQTAPLPAYTTPVSASSIRQTTQPPPAHTTPISFTPVRQTAQPTAIPNPSLRATPIRPTAQPLTVHNTPNPLIQTLPVPANTPAINSTPVQQSSEPTAAPTPAVSSANCVPNEISVKITSGNTGQQTVVKVIQSNVSPILKLRLNSNDNSLPSTSKRKSDQMNSPSTSLATEEPLAKKRRTETEVTQKLSINTSNGEQVCDQNVDKISPNSESKCRKSKRLTEKSEQTSDSPKTSRPDFEEHNRIIELLLIIIKILTNVYISGAFQRWICRKDVVKSPYLPQIGDRVVYLRPGHYEYIEWLKKKSLTSHLPNQMKSFKNPSNAKKESDHIFAIIKSIDFKSDPIHAIKLSLQLDQSSEAPEDKTVFEIEYSFLDNSEEISDFIILRQTYDMGLFMSGLIREGEPLMTIVNGFGWVKCTVISDSDFSKFFPTSLYKRFVVNLSDNSCRRLSPWDLSNISNPEIFEKHLYPPITSEDELGFYTSTPEDWPLFKCDEQTVEDIRQFACIGWTEGLCYAITLTL